jgi:hypothetical protein
MSVLTNPYVITAMVALTVIPMIVTARIKPQAAPVYIDNTFGD